MKKVKGIVMKLNTPNLNGRIYPSSVIEPEIEKLNKLLKEDKPVVGMVHNDARYTSDLLLSDVSHSITSINISKDDPDIVEAEFNLLDTPDGKLLQEYIASGNSIGCEIVSIASVNENNIVETCNIRHIDIIPSYQCAWENCTLTPVD